MASNGYMLDKSSIAKIKADHETLKRRFEHIESLVRSGLMGNAREGAVLVKTKELITAADDSTSTLGTGKADIYELQEDSSQTPDGTGYYYYGYSYEESKREEIRIYNLSVLPIPINQFVLCRRHSVTGLWIAEPTQTAIAVSNGISGRSSFTAGTGTASLYYLDSTTLTDTTKDVTVYNIASASISSGAWITIKQNSYGQWFVDMEACD